MHNIIGKGKSTKTNLPNYTSSTSCHYLLIAFGVETHTHKWFQETRHMLYAGHHALGLKSLLRQCIKKYWQPQGSFVCDGFELWYHKHSHHADRKTWTLVKRWYSEFLKLLCISSPSFTYTKIMHNHWASIPTYCLFKHYVANSLTMVSSSSLE